MPIENLKDFANGKGFCLKSPVEIIEEARDNVTRRHSYTVTQIKTNFDGLIDETEREAHQVYLKYEKQYGQDVFLAFVNYLVAEGEISSVNGIGEILGRYFKAFDKFFLSIAQSRKSRAGKTFERIHNALFKKLGYPFDEQVVIDGQPDFLMPSADHYNRNPMDCIIFTAKRTLRERWRQIVTEGTRGLGFYLATIDENVSESQLREMLDHRINLVCPQRIKDAQYPDVVNVISFAKFFDDYLDPAMERWRSNGVIE
ncbi:MAG: type II restriction endonuclease [Candidatus Margulisiibacteriota bacterium]